MMKNEFTFDQIEKGMTEHFEVTITEKMMEDFSSITGDDNPLHCTREYAQQNGFCDRVVYGMLTASMMSTVAGVYLPGKYSLINKEEMMFKSPVYVGDTLNVTGRVIDKNEKFRFIVLKIIIKNQQDATVGLGRMEVSVLK